jgi:nucleoside-diphosphate-sugar epimerase
MNGNFVTVFGGTGFLGRRVVRHLRGHAEAAAKAKRARRWQYAQAWRALTLLLNCILHAPIKDKYEVNRRVKA